MEKSPSGGEDSTESLPEKLKKWLKRRAIY